MTGWERFLKLLRELWDIVKPVDLTSTISFVLLVAMFIIAIVGRKEFGGFFKALFKMTGFFLILFILNAISPYLLGGVIAFFSVFWLCRKHWKAIGLVIFIVTVVVVLVYLFSKMGV